MSRPPDRITVDGKTVRIRIVPQKRLGRMPQGYRWSGEYEDNIITAGDGLTADDLRATVLHELLHHLWERAGIVMPAKDEEYVLHALDRWIIQMLEENPRLVRFLAGR